MPDLLSQTDKVRYSNGPTIHTFGIPAFKAKDGTVTCPYADLCVEDCYARKRRYKWAATVNAQERKLSLTKYDSFVDLMSMEIEQKKVKVLRIHDSGDFYSPSYFKKWMEICRTNTNVQFYAYTKSIPYFRRLKHIVPDNLTSILSFGGKCDHLIDRTKDRHSEIFETQYQLRKNGYANASKNDSLAYSSKNNRIGLTWR